MGRKSKQAGGHMPLTHFERTKKFASSQYGTTTKRLAGHSQYQLGDCALSLTRLSENPVMCTPSGYLYSKEAILEYLLTKTQELSERQAAFDEQQTREENTKAQAASTKRVSEFEDSQKIVKKRKAYDLKAAAKEDLKRTSYWLADSQPEAVGAVVERPPERPSSPHSQQPLKRKDIWPLDLMWDSNKLVCAISEKAIHTQAATAYWTDKKKPGNVVLTTVYDQLVKEEMRCPLTSKKVKYTRALQKSGTSFSSSGQNVEVKKYRPTIT